MGGLPHHHSPFPPARFQTHHRKAESFQPLRSLVVKDTVCGTVHSNNNVILLAPGMVARRGLLEYHRHHRHVLFHLTTQPEKGGQNYENTPQRATARSVSTPGKHSLFQHLLVLFQGFGYIEVGHHIASDKDEVGTNKGLGIHVSQHVTKGAVQVRSDKAHRVGRRVPAPLGFSGRRKKTSGRHKEAVPTDTLGHSVPVHATPVRRCKEDPVTVSPLLPGSGTLQR